MDAFGGLAFILSDCCSNMQQVLMSALHERGYWPRFIPSHIIKRSMFCSSSKFSKSFRNGLMLLAVYAMHLLFFEALMGMQLEKSPCSNVFSSHQHTPKKHDSSRSEYRLLIKHEDAKQHTTSIDLPVFDAYISALLPVFSQVEVAEVSSFSSFCLPDSAFKRYRLLQVFLI